MGKILFTERAVHATPSLAISEIKSEMRWKNDFRISGSPDMSAAEHLSLGKCVKTFASYEDSQKREAEIEEALDSADLKTDTANYVVNGKKGYAAIETKISKTGKRGKIYRVAEKRENSFNSYSTVREFGSKADAEKFAASHACANIDKAGSVVVINEKKEVTASVYLETKEYKTKPKLAPKPTRAVMPLYEYVFKGLSCVG